MITLATLKDATARQVFDQVKAHLLTQNKRSMVGDTCAYRSKDGLKCAVGCLMSDEEWTPEINTLSYINLFNKGIAPQEHMSLIICLQNIHDHGSPENWPEYLDSIEKNHLLSRETELY